VLVYVNFEPPCFWVPYVSQMVESMAKVKGASPGPAPAFQARASSSPLTASSWRACPQVKARRKVPMVDGAATHWPIIEAVAPERSRSTSSMQSARASRAEIRVIALRSAWAAPGTPLPNELPHLEPSRQLRAQGQTGVGHQVAVIEGDVEMVARVRDLHLTGDPLLRRWFRSIPLSQLDWSPVPMSGDRPGRWIQGYGLTGSNEQQLGVEGGVSNISPSPVLW